MRKFCVLTVGRAGSTALMDRLERYPDIAVPSKNIACVDQELVHPARLQAQADAYAKLCGKTIATPEQLIDCFFEFNAAAALGGKGWDHSGLVRVLEHLAGHQVAKG